MFAAVIAGACVLCGVAKEVKKRDKNSMLNQRSYIWIQHRI